uniref:Uncharacterized protein n=1 Tax=Rangifer tarandus platyrhynchus TaxID=3082113 RepID=A0ACB0E2I6_RANTA|nr:unnamed protein product [Rangifer tarandus platyrhynchus]
MAHTTDPSLISSACKKPRRDTVSSLQSRADAPAEPPSSISARRPCSLSPAPVGNPYTYVCCAVSLQPHTRRMILRRLVSEASFAESPAAGKVRHAREVPRGHQQAATAGQQSRGLEVGDQLSRLACLRAETGTA